VKNNWVTTKFERIEEILFLLLGKAFSHIEKKLVLELFNTNDRLIASNCVFEWKMQGEEIKKKKCLVKLKFYVGIRHHDFLLFI